jgi:hypothetical protein
LPSVALGKAFAKHNLAFAERLRRSANPLSAVVDAELVTKKSATQSPSGAELQDQNGT